MPALFAAGLAVAAFILRRDALVWGPAWLCLAVTVGLELLAQSVPAVRMVAAFTGSLFPFLMLVGALRFSGRGGEAGGFAAGLVIGAIRAVLQAMGFAVPAAGIALVVDPLAMLVAAWISFSFVRQNSRPMSDHVVAPALVVIGGLEAYAGYRQLFEPAAIHWPVWLAFVLPVAAVQVYSALKESGRAKVEALRALAENEKRFRVITEHTQDLISELGPDGRFVYVSPNHRLLGITPADAVGKRVEDLGHLMEPYVTASREPAPREGTFDSVTKVRTPAGQERYYESRSTASVSEDGERRIVSISRDVTDRVLAEESRRSDRERLRTILSSLPKTRVSLLGRDLEVRALLPGDVRERHGIRWSDVEGEKIDRFLSPEEAARWRSLVAEVLDTGEVRQLRQEVALPQATLWYDTILSRLRTDDDEEAVLAVSHDVTDQVAAEEERREFESRVQQSQSFESLGLLAGGIAHDFNNLLVGIAGNVELAQRTVSPESKLAPRLRDIGRASKRAAELTEQLLAYAGKGDIRVAALDLAALVKDTIQVLPPTVSNAVELAVEVVDSGAWISADSTQIGRVVMNLFTNASEAIQNGGHRIVCRTGVMDADAAYLAECHPAGDLAAGSYSYLEVEDDGPGMSPQTVARIFAPFYSSHGLGRGLGLAVVFGVVKSHGGTVHVETRPGEGTKFRVLFPSVDPVEAEVVEAGPAEPRSGRGTILLVDDEDTVREVARQFLELGGFDVVEASRGADAVELFRARTDGIHAALLDVSMPEMDGAETLAALRALREDLPVVFMSGHSATDMGRIGGESAQTGRVRKPFGLTELQEALREVLDARSVHESD